MPASLNQLVWGNNRLALPMGDQELYDKIQSVITAASLPLPGNEKRRGNAKRRCISRSRSRRSASSKLSPPEELAPAHAFQPTGGGEPCPLHKSPPCSSQQSSGSDINDKQQRATVLRKLLQTKKAKAQLTSADATSMQFLGPPQGLRASADGQETNAPVAGRASVRPPRVKNLSWRADKS